MYYIYQVQSADILTSIDTGKPLNNRVHCSAHTQAHRYTSVLCRFWYRYQTQYKEAWPKFSAHFTVHTQLWARLNQFARSADISGDSQEPLRRFCVHPKALASTEAPGYRILHILEVEQLLYRHSSENVYWSISWRLDSLCSGTVGKIYENRQRGQALGYRIQHSLQYTLVAMGGWPAVLGYQICTPTLTIWYSRMG